MAGLDDVLGPVSHLVVDPPDVLTDDAEGEELDAAEQADQDDDGGVADGEPGPGELDGEVREREEEGEPGDDEARDGDQLERVAGEPDDAIQPDDERSGEAVVLAGPDRPRIPVVDDAGLAEPDETDESRKKP